MENGVSKEKPISQTLIFPGKTIRPITILSTTDRQKSTVANGHRATRTVLYDFKKGEQDFG
jgi:hypothetical protein